MFENLKAQIDLLLAEIAQDPEDPHALQEALREKLSEMKALGMPLPADLVELETYLQDDLEIDGPTGTGEGDEAEGDTA